MVAHSSLARDLPGPKKWPVRLQTRRALLTKEVSAMEKFECADFACEAEWAGDGSAVISVRGELDMHTSEELAELLGRLHERGITDHLVVDLSECAFMDSIGLSVLISAQHVAKSRLNLVVTHKALRRVLTVTGFANIFTLHETKDEALEELRRQVGNL
jgi:anti-sigma B factor antagonist